MALKSTIRRRVGKALKKYVRGNAGWRKTGLGKRSIRASKKRWLKRGHTREEIKRVLTHMKKQNPPKVKGRKVKGGRAVSLKNFTGTIVKRANGTVQILGRGKRK
jgi:hypothetical protein